MTSGTPHMPDETLMTELKQAGAGAWDHGDTENAGEGVEPDCDRFGDAGGFAVPDVENDGG